MNPLIAPIQGDASLQEYCKMFQMYALADSGIDEKLIKTRFTCGLATLDNQKEVIRFGVNKPLTEIITHLKRLESASEIARHAFENTVQGNDSVLTFYAKIKHDFIRGLNSENGLEVYMKPKLKPQSRNGQLLGPGGRNRVEIKLKRIRFFIINFKSQ